jgi:LCP family protein required for cell wall assembly
VVALLVAAYLVFLVATPAWAWGRIAKVATDTGSADNSRGTTFLVVGSDARSTMTPAERKELGTGHTGGQRTDSIMLLHIPGSGDPTLVSIPRDSYVTIPGHGSNKINAAFSFGGAKLLTQTVENATGLHVDGYLEIGFVGFVDVVDAVGGVHMCLDKAMNDKDAHVDLKAGCQELNGKQALGFVRARHSQARGDLDRVEHQRQLVAAVMKKALGPSTLLPWRYWSLVQAGSHSLTVGDNTSLVDVLRFTRAMRSVSSGHGTTTTVPVADANFSTSAGSTVLWDKAKAAAFFAALNKA